MRAYLDERRSPLVDEALAAALRADLGLTDAALRRTLRELGVPMAPLVEGIRQDSWDNLERTLLAMLTEYEATSDRARRQACRTEVIRAKDHARLALARETGDAHTARTEMILWMRTWLENPGVFPQWLALRKRVSAV